MLKLMTDSLHLRSNISLSLVRLAASRRRVKLLRQRRSDLIFESTVYVIFKNLTIILIVRAMLQLSW